MNNVRVSSEFVFYSSSILYNTYSCVIACEEQTAEKKIKILLIRTDNTDMPTKVSRSNRVYICVCAIKQRVNRRMTFITLNVGHVKAKEQERHTIFLSKTATIIYIYVWVKRTYALARIIAYTHIHTGINDNELKHVLHYKIFSTFSLLIAKQKRKSYN